MTPIKYSHEAFARHIAENPHDTAAPLVYADWLADHGMPTAERIVREHVAKVGTPDILLYNGLKHGHEGSLGSGSWDGFGWHEGEGKYGVGIYLPAGDKTVSMGTVADRSHLESILEGLKGEGFHVGLQNKPHSYGDKDWHTDLPLHHSEEPHQMSRDEEDPLVAFYARSLRKAEIDNKKIHDQIAGTRLAYHLKQIQGDYADRADPTASRVKELAGLALKGATGGDPYTELGSLLKQDEHKLASAYNWHRVTEGLNVDHAVKSYLDRVTAKERAKGTKGIYQTVSRMMDHHDGTAMGGDQYERFWKGLRKHLADQLGGVVDRWYWTDDRLNKSLLRHAYREQDRADLAGETPKVEAPESGPKPTSHSWQKYFGMVPAKTTGVESAERFKREAEYHKGER